MQQNFVLELFSTLRTVLEDPITDKEKLAIFTGQLELVIVCDVFNGV